MELLETVIYRHNKTLLKEEEQLAEINKKIEDAKPEYDLNSAIEID